MKAIIEAAFERSRTTLAALVLILVAGAIAYVEIPKESDPDVNIPIIYVRMVHEGISPEDGERLLLRPMEQELRRIEGVKEMRSQAYEGGGFVLLEFDAGFDAGRALDDVRAKVDVAKADLPSDTKEPTIHEVNLSLLPVVVVTVSGSADERTLLHLARRLRDRIEGIPAVLRGELAGQREELVEFVIDPLRLESYGIDANYVIGLISRSNRLIAAGALDTGDGRFAIKVPGLFQTAADMMAMPLKASGDAVVRIADVAEVRRTFKDRESYARLNGQPAIAIEVSKRIGENIIDTIDQVRAVAEAEAATWPPGAQITFSQDRSGDIRLMLSDLANNMVSAVILVMIVTVAALGLRSAGLVGVAIPGSFLLSILVLAAFGLTVNVVVLFGLIMAVGIVVDGATVLVEYADRKMSEGASPRAAYKLAAQRMAWPIISSTATTLAAFLPLLFWPGVVGEFMKFLPITLLATLTAALLMALIFMPALGGLIGRPAYIDPAVAAAVKAGQRVRDDDLAIVDPRSFTGVTGGYVRLLRLALAHPAKVLLLAAGLLVGVQMFYATHGKGVEFFPKIEPDTALVYVHARGNLSIEEKRRLALEVERQIRAIDAFDSVYARIGKQTQGGQDIAEDVIASFQLEFRDWNRRPPAQQVLDEIARRTAHLSGIVVEPTEQRAGPPVGKPIQIEISAIDPSLLLAEAARLRGKLDSMAGLINIEDTRPLPGIDWQVSVDRAQAAKYDADLSLVGSYVQLVTKGLKVSTYRPDDSDEEIDIVVRFPEAYRSLDQLDAIRIQTPGGLVPVGNFVQREPVPSTGTLKRTDGRRVMLVKADVAPGVLADDKVREIRQWLAENPGDPRIDHRFKGEDEEQKKASAFLGKAFGAALFIMAMILITQFNSFYSTLLILSAVVMSTIGVFIGLLVMDMPFGIVMGGIGVISLAGVVVSNNIILIDTYNVLRRDIADPREALLLTGAQRLRPVFLTQATTILGLIPMMFQVNLDLIGREMQVGAPSTQWWTQISTAICFGLTFATVLTLVVTPAALMLRVNVEGWLARRRARRAPLAIAEAAE